MHSMHTRVGCRQPCSKRLSLLSPSCSRSSKRGSLAAAGVARQHLISRTQHTSLVCRSSLLSHEDFQDSSFHHQQPHSQQQHRQDLQQQAFTAPSWHPQLLGVAPTKRAALEQASRQYFTEVWNSGCVDLLDELAADGVCFNDALGMEEDAFSRSSLKALVREFQATHPLLRYDLEDIIVDEQRDTVVVHYTVTAAHLLPQPGSAAGATGHVSVVSGMDRLHFNKQGMISSILSFRQRFSEEEVELIDWESV